MATLDVQLCCIFGAKEVVMGEERRKFIQGGRHLEKVLSAVIL